MGAPPDADVDDGYTDDGGDDELGLHLAGLLMGVGHQAANKVGLTVVLRNRCTILLDTLFLPRSS